MYPLVFLLFALIASAIHIWRTPKKTLRTVSEILLLYLIFFNIGLQGVWGFMGHAFMADKIATEIGWPIGSPFQFEVAVANLGIGIAGLLASFFRGKFWLAILIIESIFIYGAAYGHFVQYARGDHAPYNSGIFLWTGDLLIPTIIIVVGVVYWYSLTHAKPSKTS